MLQNTLAMLKGTVVRSHGYKSHTHSHTILGTLVQSNALLLLLAIYAGFSEITSASVDIGGVF